MVKSLSTRTDRELISATLGACWRSGLSVISHQHHLFHPIGLTMVVLLAESHLAIHTYPEQDLIYVDCFTCSPIHDPEQVIRTLCSLIGGEISLMQRTGR